MVYYKLYSVIDKLSNCNGTFDAEVDKLIADGTVQQADVPLVVLYAKMRRLSTKLDVLSEEVHQLK